LYRNRKEAAQQEKQYTKNTKTIHRHRVHKTENKNTKQERKKKNIKKRMSSNY